MEEADIVVEQSSKGAVRVFKLWKARGSRVAHNTAMCACNRVVHHTMSEVEVAF